MKQSLPNSDVIMHIRRCHVCDHITESAQAHIEKCGSCGKGLVPYLFCKDVGVDELTSDFRSVNVDSNHISQILRSEYPPIFGISLYWS